MKIVIARSSMATRQSFLVEMLRFDYTSEKGIAPVEFAGQTLTSPTSSESAESSSLPPHFTSEKGIFRL